MTQLVNSMNDFFVSFSADLLRFDSTHRVFVSNMAMEASLKEHCLDPRTFWFILMSCKHHAPYLNVLTTALYLMFAITVVCLQ